MEALRAAAREAITTLSHEPIMAEDFGALPHSPQVACLDGVRQAGLVVLILGARYGAKQASGLSATHEEFQEARDRCPVLVFVQEGISPEPEQAAFLIEVEAWKSGLMRESFSSSTDLQAKVTRSIHRLELATATAPFDGEKVLARALACFPGDERGYHRGAAVSVAVVGGPAQTILRPSQMEAPELVETLEKEALYGTTRIFARSAATKASMEDDMLILSQDDRSERRLRLDAQGGILIRQPLEDDNDRHGMSVVIVETVKDRLIDAIRYSNWLLEEIDPTQRLSHVVIAVSVSGGFGMRTRAEHLASPNSISLNSFGQGDRPPVHLTPAHIRRPALIQNLTPLVDDLITLLRRQWK
jgi:hypothetical protein